LGKNVANARRILFNLQHFLDPKLLYYSVTFIHLRYGILAWGTCQQNNS